MPDMRNHRMSEDTKKGLQLSLYPLNRIIKRTDENATSGGEPELKLQHRAALNVLINTHSVFPCCFCAIERLVGMIDQDVPICPVHGERSYADARSEPADRMTGDLLR
jgi:hypothetical protein